MTSTVSVQLMVYVAFLISFDSDDPAFKDAPIRPPAKVEGDLRFLQPDGLQDGSFSQDGKFLVTLSPDATIRLWEMATGKMVQRFEAWSYGHVARPVLSPDSRKLYAGTGIWDVQTGKIETTVSAWFWTLSHDGKTLVTLHARPPVEPDEPGKVGERSRHDGFDVKLRDATGKELRTLPKMDGTPEDVILSRDGKMLAIRHVVGSDATRLLTLFDLTAKIPQARGIGSWKGIGNHFALSPDGKTLAITAPYRPNPKVDDDRAWITIVDTQTGNLLHSLSDHLAEINYVEFLPDGRLLSVDDRAALILWNLSTGPEPSFVKHRRGDIRYWKRASLTADAKKALVFPPYSHDQMAQAKAPHPLLIDLADGKVESLARPSDLRPAFPEPKKKEEWVGDRDVLGDAYLRLSDGRWLHYRNHIDQHMWLRAKDKKTLVKEFPATGFGIHLSDDGKRMYQIVPDYTDKYPSTYWWRGQRFGGKTGNALRVWSLVTLKDLHTLGGEIPIQQFWVSPDEKMVAILHADHWLRIWDVATGKVKYRLELPPLMNRLGARSQFSPDSRFFLTEAVGVRVIWSLTAQ